MDEGNFFLHLSAFTKYSQLHLNLQNLQSRLKLWGLLEALKLYLKYPSKLSSVSKCGYCNTGKLAYYYNKHIARQEG